MWRSVKLILTELARPDAQKENWFAWAAAQMAHGLIGAVLAGALAFMLPLAWAFGVAALGYAALKEGRDFRTAPGWAMARDCAQDALFVTAGAALAVAIFAANAALFFAVLFAAAAGLFLGVWARIAPKEGA